MSWPLVEPERKASINSLTVDAAQHLSHRWPSTPRPGAAACAGRVPTANPNRDRLRDAVGSIDTGSPKCNVAASSVHTTSEKRSRGGLVIVWSLVDARWRAERHWKFLGSRRTPGAGRKSAPNISGSSPITAQAGVQSHLRSHRDQTGALRTGDLGGLDDSGVLPQSHRIAVQSSPLKRNWAASTSSSRLDAAYAA